jgi:hypothetical protein
VTKQDVVATEPRKRDGESREEIIGISDTPNQCMQGGAICLALGGGFLVCCCLIALGLLFWTLMPGAIFLTLNPLHGAALSKFNGINVAPNELLLRMEVLQWRAALSSRVRFSR